MSILNRLIEIRDNENIGKTKFEEILGKSSGYISVLQKKNSIPGSDVILKASEYFRRYSMDWLITGEGNMLKTENQNAYTKVSDKRFDYKSQNKNRLERKIEALTKENSTLREHNKTLKKYNTMLEAQLGVDADNKKAH